MQDKLLSLVGTRSGHFVYESGHHAELWLDLERLCMRPAELAPMIAQLASKLAVYRVDAVCGPLVEGAFIALLISKELGCTFTYANRFAPETPSRSRTEQARSREREGASVKPIAESNTELFRVEYCVPDVLRPVLKGKRIAIVNDAISAGSAVRGTYQNLLTLGAEVVAIGCLLLLGDLFVTFAAAHSLPLVSLMQMPNPLWTPNECPLCKRGEALENFAVA